MYCMHSTTTTQVHVLPTAAGSKSSRAAVILNQCTSVQRHRTATGQRRTRPELKRTAPERIGACAYQIGSAPLNQETNASSPGSGLRRNSCRSETPKEYRANTRGLLHWKPRLFFALAAIAVACQIDSQVGGVGYPRQARSRDPPRARQRASFRWGALAATTTAPLSVSPRLGTYVVASLRRQRHKASKARQWRRSYSVH